MEKFPKIGVIYLAYGAQRYWERAGLAMEKINYPREKICFAVVDNFHPSSGASAVFVKNHLPGGWSETTVLSQDRNLGFAGGNNVGIRWALARGCDYIYLHNQDGFMAPDCLARAAEALEADKSIGAAQSLIMLYPETDLINTAGNKLHFLGFGYSGYYRRSVAEAKKTVSEVAYASGAGMILRADLLRQYGLLDEDLFAYHEDLEYCLRLRAWGYKIAVVPASVFFHEYEFSRNTDKFFLMERNRLAVTMMYYKWPTLLAFLLPELGVKIAECFAAFTAGWLGAWWRAHVYWFSPAHRRLWLDKRRKIQKNRVVGDRELLRLAVGKIEMEGFGGPLVKFGNFFLNIYWALIKRIIFW